MKVTFYLSGTGFKPGVDIKLTFVGGTSTYSIGGAGSTPLPPKLHTSKSGAFGPEDIQFDSSEPPGPHTITASDGSCEASLMFTLVK